MKGRQVDDCGTVYLHVWSGDAELARDLVRQHFPGAPAIELSLDELRGGGWKAQLRTLFKLRGKALVMFFNSLDDAPQLQLVLISALVHRCRETIVADMRRNLRVYRRLDCLRLLPRTMASAAADALVLLVSLVVLSAWKRVVRPVRVEECAANLDVAYLFPFPFVRDTAGGAISHIRGVLSGISANNATCQVFSGAPLQAGTFPAHRIDSQRKLFLFWETVMLSYSIRFAQMVNRMLGNCRPRIAYQRHGPFTVAGAIYSQWARVPLVLEYNASELWVAHYWGPSRFLTWLRVCEEFVLACASVIVVVSEPIGKELLDRGIPSDRILLNPNAVDPEQFRPGCGGRELRQSLGISDDEVVVVFVGTFGPWHGIPILRDAIIQLMADNDQEPFRFLLVGDGNLHADLRHSLEDLFKAGKVILPGMVPHHVVRSYLDAADILVSPHVAMPDGRPFFGSPTKLFEYMSMGKAIVASNLDQLAQVLQHDHTALLVQPGDVAKLADAMRLLAKNPFLRQRLGREARRVTIERHTWRHNVSRVLERAGLSDSHPYSVEQSTKQPGLRKSKEYPLVS